MALRQPPLPREISPLAKQLSQRLFRPVERFLHIESASGIVLLCAAILALIWANSPWSGLYDDFVHLPLGIQFGEWVLDTDLHFFVNDILMVVFSL